MIGQTVGHYRIIEKIGVGGMGEVYRAQDTRLGRSVALKILPDVFAKDVERLARFEREAQLLASLNHPNIAAIYGLEESDGVRCLVLELVPGETLAERLGRGALPLEEALPIAKQVAEALEYAHEHGIIHRDLKPGNIKVTPKGTVKVLDFGLAKVFEDEGAAGDPSASPTLGVAATRAGVILGTAAYMSPEQAKGRPMDKRADIWAFGCVLYETLTGRQVFGGDTIADSLASILKSEPDWTSLPESTPPNIRVLLRRCLEKDRNRRLHDIADARIEIEETLSGRAAPAVRVSAARFPALPLWRRALPWGLASLFALATIFAYWQWQRAAGRSGAQARRFSVVTNFSGVEVQPSLSPDGRSVVFVSDRDGQFDIWMGLVVGGNLVRITNDANLEARPRWSPDGTKIAYGRLNEDGLWDIWVVPALGGTPRKLLANATDPAWSPDGRSLAYANLSTNTIWVCDATGGNPRQATQPEQHFVIHRQPAYSLDARQLAFVRRRGAGGPYGELAAVELASGKVRHLTEDGALVLSPAWAPDGESIYFASSRGGATNIWKIPARGGSLEQVTAGQGDDVDPDVSADGKRVVFSTYRMNINLEELALDSKDGRRPKWLTSDSARQEVAPAYSPDGKRIAYFTARQGAEAPYIWVMNADGSDAVQVVGDERGISVFPRWVPDGQSLVYIARRGIMGIAEVWRIAPDGSSAEKLRLTVFGDTFYDVGPGGRVVFTAADEQIHIFDPTSNQDQTLEGIHGRLPRWSPDGRAFAYIVPARRQGDAEAGLWIYKFGKPPRQVFRGWVSWCAWASPDELFLAAGKPDLNAALLRVRRDGTPPTRVLSVRMLDIYWALFPQLRFDVHPDGKRIAVEALELREAGIGMIEFLP